MRKYLYIFIAFLTLTCISCNKSNSGTEPSSVARLTAFSFAKNDSMPGLAKAVFTVEERIDTGLVWNKDSILYGTSLTRVVPKFTFAATPGAAIMRLGDTTVTLTGFDTLDFTRTPIYLTIRSADRSTLKTYEIRATVHAADPDLYVWQQLTDHIYDPDDSEQRVVEIGDSFVLIKSNGWWRNTYQSTDGITWTDLGEPTGLPAGTKVRQIISDGTTLYYGQDEKIYTSTDGVTWEAQNTDYQVVTMLMYWNQLVWALIENEGYQLAVFNDGQLDTTALRPTGNFPVSDFATVTFQSASLRERAMIIGGFADNGQSLNTRWNLEYTTHPLPDGEYRLQEFSIGRPAFTTLTGISVIRYANQLLLFGGVDENMQYFGRDILISTDEGLNWTAADSTKNHLPDVYQARQKQTAIVRDNNIYLFGGQDSEHTYSDVYKGRLNSIDWDTTNN